MGIIEKRLLRGRDPTICRDAVGETRREAGQTASTIVQTTVNIDAAVDPEDEDGVTDETNQLPPMTTCSIPVLSLSMELGLERITTRRRHAPWRNTIRYTDLLHHPKQSTSFSGSASLSGLKFFKLRL